MPKHRYLYKCDVVFKFLATIGYVNWVTHLREHVLANGFGYICISQNVTNEVFLSEYVQRLKDQYVQL